MHPAALIHGLLLALDGEASTGNNTPIAIIALVSMASGYILLAGLWFFVFREKARSKRRNGSPPDEPR